MTKKDINKRENNDIFLGVIKAKSAGRETKLPWGNRKAPCHHKEGSWFVTERNEILLPAFTLTFATDESVLG